MEINTSEKKPSLPISSSGSLSESKIQDKEEINFDFNWIIYVLKRRKLPAIGIFIGMIGIGTLLSFKNPPEYQATVTLKIEEKKKVFDLEEYMRFENVNADFYASQIKLLQSRRLIRDVIEKLRLDQNPEALHISKETIQKLSSNTIRKEPNSQVASLTLSFATPSSLVISLLVDRYLNQLNVSSEKRTPQIVTLRFTANQPETAAQIANTHAGSYIRLSSFSNSQFTDEYISGLEEQLNKINSELKQNEEKVLSFNKLGFFEIQGAGYNNPISDIDDRLSRIRLMTAEALSNLTKAKTAYESMFQLDFIGNMKYLKEEALTSLTLNGLRLNKNELSQQWEQVKAKYLENHPEYIQLKNKLASLETAIKEEINSLVEQAKKAYEEGVARSKELQAQEDQLRKEKLEKEVQWSTLQDLRRTQEQIFKQKTLIVVDLQKAKGSLNSQKETQNRTFEVVDYAEVPTKASNRNLPRILLLTFAIALSTTVIGVMMIEFFDRKIRNPNQLEQLTGISVLGCLPQFKEEEVPIKGGDSLFLSAVGEAFITLRTRFLFSNMINRSKTVLFTSVNPKEGKSTILINLASSIAMLGKRVIMLDCDLRKPRIHRLYGKEINPGLSEVIHGKENLEQVIYPTDIPNLFFIPAGMAYTTPTEILSSPSFDDLLEQLKKNFDFIFLDSPPVLSFPESSILSSKLDVTLLVIRSGEITQDELLITLENIKRAGGSIFSTILNCVPPSEQGNLRYAYSYTQDPGEAIPEIK